MTDVEVLAEKLSGVMGYDWGEMSDQSVNSDDTCREEWRIIARWLIDKGAFPDPIDVISEPDVYYNKRKEMLG